MMERFKKHVYAQIIMYPDKFKDRIVIRGKYYGDYLVIFRENYASLVYPKGWDHDTFEKNLSIGSLELIDGNPGVAMRGAYRVVLDREKSRYRYEKSLRKVTGRDE